MSAKKKTKQSAKKNAAAKKGKKKKLSAAAIAKIHKNIIRQLTEPYPDVGFLQDNLQDNENLDNVDQADNQEYVGPKTAK